MAASRSVRKAERKQREFLDTALRVRSLFGDQNARLQLDRMAFRNAVLANALRNARSVYDRSDHNLIADSGLFDATYYRAQTGLDDEDEAALIDHYLARGAADGLSPHRLFDGAAYAALHPDIGMTGIEPFSHFLRYGAEEERAFHFVEGDLFTRAEQGGLIRFSGLFDEPFYRSRHDVGDQDAVDHYLDHGAVAGHDPHTQFDSAAYLAANPDVAAARTNPFYHFLRYGVAEGRALRPNDGSHDKPRSEPRLTDKVVGAVLRAFGYRIVRPALPNRIGHLVEDFGGYLRARILQGKTKKPVYIVETEACNSVVLDYLRPYLTVIEGGEAKRWRGLLDIPGLVDNLEHDFAYTMEGASPCFALHEAWRGRPPLFTLTEDHARIGRGRMRELGLPDDAWFVCLHAREAGYSASDSDHHAYRDVEIETYFLAVREIVRRGGWCVRMGDASMRPLPTIPGLIDYARSPQKSDLMDVVLCGECRFFLGSSSGLFLLSSAFGVPSALANMAPLGSSFSFLPADISIPKLYLASDGTPIPFPRIIDQPIADFRWSGLLDEAGVILQSNSADEILELAKEMLDRLEGAYRTDAGAEARQARFRAMFGPHNYSWGSAARIGEAFLQKHAALLDDPSPDLTYFHHVPWSGGAMRNPAAGTRRRPMPSV